MASAGSPCPFNLSSSTAPSAAMKPSCISCGFIRTSVKRYKGTSTATILDCYFSSNRMKRIWKKYQQNTLQPLGNTVWPSKRRIKRFQVRVSSAPSEEGITVHGIPCTKLKNDGWEETRKKLDASLDIVATGTNLVQALHETARTFQVAVERQRSLTKGPWFTKAWLGIDHSAWIKSIAYQAAVHALIQAALNIARRSEDKSSDACTIVQQSLLHLCNPLEDSIRHHLSSRDPAAEEWLWYQQHPLAVSNFTSSLEKDPRFTAVAILDWQEAAQIPKKETDAAVLMLAVSLCAAIMKLGPGKLSCSFFSSALSEETGRLMDSLLEYLSIDQVYQITSSVGLRREFLTHFGPRAAFDKSDIKVDEEERMFWIELVQQSLRGALAREGVRSKLTSVPNIEVLEQDLAVFGFFAALGRRARSLLTARKIDFNDSMSSLFRYLEGGSVLFYPQLATLTTYQLFVEVVSDELAWIPFFEENLTSSRTNANVRKDKGDLDQLISQEEEVEALATALNTCSFWVDDFMMYSKWIQQAESVRAVKFLANIQSRICECSAANSFESRRDGSNRIVISRAAIEVEQTLKRLLFEDLNYNNNGENGTTIKRYRTWDWREISEQSSSIRDKPEDVNLQQLEEQLKFFDEDLQNVEEVLSKLEGFLTESELSTFGKGREHLTAIRIDLQKIRRLKKEAEVLEASLKFKASLKEKTFNQAKLEQTNESQKFKPSSFNPENNEDVKGDENRSWQQGSRVGNVFEEAANIAQVLSKKLPFFTSTDADEAVLQSEASLGLSIDDDDAFDIAAAAALEEAAAVSNEVAQFEALRHELIQLDSRIRDCGGETSMTKSNSVDLTLGKVSSGSSSQKDKTGVEKGKIWDFVSKSTKKFKNSSLDVLRGTQLLATDVAAAVALLRSSISGHELTERERKILKRTCADLASVIPIGFLMLLPVTAVGHAAMLAAIQKYVPALIPSAYAPERLDLLKQLEQLRQMEVEATGLDADSVPSIHFSERVDECLQETQGRKQERPK